MKEIVDLYTPELLYSDSALPFGEVFDEKANEEYRWGLEAVSYFYNKCEQVYGPSHAVYTQKNQHEEIYRVGVLDIERSQLPDISPVPWQAETCIGEWFYHAKIKYKTPDHVIDILIDSIAKNGTMLLNIPQRPDGTIDEQSMWLLDELAKWFAINGEAVYGTRPWRVSGEGVSRVTIKGFTEDKVQWTPCDYRFAQKDGKLYAFIMSPQVGRVAVIRSIREEEHVRAVRLLGYGAVTYEQTCGSLIVKLPDRLPTEYVNTLEITF